MINQENFKLEVNLDDIKPGNVKVYNLNDKSIVLANINNEYFAVENICSHQHIPLNPDEIVNENEIECPKHGARFKLQTGMPVCLPAVKPIKTYKVKIEAHQLIITE